MTSTADHRMNWVSQAHCRSANPEDLFVRGAAQRTAAKICRHCPVRRDCAADALDNQIEYGVWGGLTERERRALLHQHPDVASWAELLTGIASNQLTLSTYAAAPS